MESVSGRYFDYPGINVILFQQLKLESMKPCFLVKEDKARHHEECRRRLLSTPWGTRLDSATPFSERERSAKPHVAYALDHLCCTAYPLEDKLSSFTLSRRSHGLVWAPIFGPAALPNRKNIPSSMVCSRPCGMTKMPLPKI
jgi:hypothetical protein